MSLSPSPGISGKSQVLFALVFTTRYLDLVLNFVSIYNTVMKVIFLVSAYGTLFLMFVKFKATYDSNHDTFRAEFLVIPAVGLACLVNHEFSVLEVRKFNSDDPLPYHVSPTCLSPPPLLFTSPLSLSTDFVDILHLPGECCHNASALHDLQDR